MKVHRRILIAALLALTTACGSTKPYGKHRATLMAAEQSLEQAQFATAQKQLEALIVETSGAAEDYALQRYFAAVLLTRLHLAASMHGPYLTEPVGITGTTQKPSWIAHTVAATYEASFAEAWSAAAMRSPAVMEGEELLPESLKSFGADNAMQFLKLTRLIAAARLRFQEGVSGILAEWPELKKLEACEAAMANVALDPAMKPWLLFGVFDYLKRRDEPLAYRFGIRARELAADSSSAREARLGEVVVRWIEEESAYVFESSRGVPFNANLTGDPDANQLNADYRARKKETP